MEIQVEERRYSIFWPVLIFLAAFALSCFYQLAQVVERRHLLNQRYTAEAANLPKAQDVQNHLVALLNDLVASSSRDPGAALIIQEAKQAGILHEKPPATGTAPVTGP